MCHGLPFSHTRSAFVLLMLLDSILIGFLWKFCCVSDEKVSRWRRLARHNFWALLFSVFTDREAHCCGSFKSVPVAGLTSRFVSMATANSLWHSAFICPPKLMIWVLTHHNFLLSFKSFHNIYIVIHIELIFLNDLIKKRGDGKKTMMLLKIAIGKILFCKHSFEYWLHHCFPCCLFFRLFLKLRNKSPLRPHLNEWVVPRNPFEKTSRNRGFLTVVICRASKDLLGTKHAKFKSQQHFPYSSTHRSYLCLTVSTKA